MNIKFRGKYKSLTDFDWDNIPMFSVITGPNGTGKSQLLNIIYNTIVNNPNEKERVQIENFVIKREEVSFLKGEWNLSNTSSTDLSTIQQKRTSHYNTFKQNNIKHNDVNQRALYAEFQLIKQKLGKNHQQITKDEFDELFPDIIIEQEQLLSQKIEEIFYNYRLSEIESLALKKQMKKLFQILEISLGLY